MDSKIILLGIYVILIRTLIFTFAATDLDDMFHFEKALKHNVNHDYYNDEAVSEVHTARETMPCHKNLESLQEQINHYITRYLNLFLRATDLKRQDFEKSGNSMVSIDFEFVTTVGNIALLQNLSKDINSKKAFHKLYIIDEILSNGLIIKVKEPDNLSYIFSSIFTLENFYFLALLLSSKYFYYVIALLFSIYVVKYKHFFSNKAVALFAFILLNTFIFIEGILHYIAKKQKVELDKYIKEVECLENCQWIKSDSGWFWSGIYSYIYGCSKCHNLNNPTDTISPVMSVLEVFSIYYIQFPAKVFGSSLFTFASIISDSFPCWSRWIIYIVALAIGSLVFIALVKPFSSIRMLGVTIERNKYEQISSSQSQSGSDIPKLKGSKSASQNIYIQLVQPGDISIAPEGVNILPKITAVSKDSKDVLDSNIVLNNEEVIPEGMLRQRKLKHEVEREITKKEKEDIYDLKYNQDVLNVGERIINLTTASEGNLKKGELETPDTYGSKMSETAHNDQCSLLKSMSLSDFDHGTNEVGQEEIFYSKNMAVMENIEDSIKKFTDENSNRGEEHCSDFDEFESDGSEEFLILEGFQRTD